MNGSNKSRMIRRKFFRSPPSASLQALAQLPPGCDIHVCTAFGAPRPPGKETHDA
jgi:hypothetical protein